MPSRPAKRCSRAGRQPLATWILARKPGRRGFRRGEIGVPSARQHNVQYGGLLRERVQQPVRKRLRTGLLGRRRALQADAEIHADGALVDELARLVDHFRSEVDDVVLVQQVLGPQ